MPKEPENYHSNVFINCPFDNSFSEMFNAIVFTVHACGFIAKCAKEFDDSDDVRIDKIIKLIKSSKFGIHDFSRLSGASSLPRFNMPLELGIFMGAQKFGSANDKRKKYLILASKQFEYQAFMSDTSGQDIKHHEDDPIKALYAVRDWLSHKSSPIPSPGHIKHWYEDFKKDLPKLCQENNWIPNELTFREYSSLITSWLILNGK